ncbi:MAG: hypothetical protein H0X33_05860 [Taibaiella sp.]|nr:hypothetical protein [Taibaiella sp.]
MNRNPEHVLVFRSNIKTENDKYRVSSLLDTHPLIKDWSVDTSDEDCVLRVVSEQLQQEQIIHLVSKCGYQCEELQD